MTIPEATEAFWLNVERRDGCWIWIRALDQDGYGTWRGHRAHRITLASVERPKHARLQALHRCDVRACVNPDHLYWGTAADNSRDRLERTPDTRVRRVPNKRARGVRLHAFGISDDLWERVQTATKYNDETTSEIVRKALAAYVKRTEAKRKAAGE